MALGTESIDYPGDPPFRREEDMSLAGGDAFAHSHLKMSAHCGTHLDAPAHFFRDGQTISDLPLSTCILPATVVEIENPLLVGAGEIDGNSCPPGEALLFKTDNSRRGLVTAGSYSDDYVYLDREGAARCREMGVGLVGFDYITVDGHGDLDFPAHHTLLGAGILLLEAINLAAVPPGRYTLFCLPLKLAAGEAAPARAVLFPPGTTLGYQPGFQL